MGTTIKIAGQSVIALPADFDPEANPIIARHWFGIEPAWRHVGQVAERIVDRIGSRCAVAEDDRDAA